MKIRQCFLELQLKMSGMFFETHCTFIFAETTQRRWIVLVRRRDRASNSDSVHSQKRHNDAGLC